ncbi:MAG: sulfurtransferase TusE [Gammaproteobacteria bacterium]|nr:MAG: sulfurtransferase TusE [Gammaproteobacteria bacterium]
MTRMTELHADAFDEYGFLKDPERWDRELAGDLAEKLGVGPLGDEHWALIDYVRERWLKHQAIEPNQVACAHLELEDHCVWRLFGGPVELWKVAGLPYPGTEAYTYMENEEPPVSQAAG